MKIRFNIIIIIRSIIWTFAGLLAISGVLGVIGQLQMTHEFLQEPKPEYRIKTIHKIYKKLQSQGGLTSYTNIIRKYPQWTFAADITQDFMDNNASICHLTTQTYAMCYSPGTQETIDLRESLKPENAAQDIALIAYDPTNGTRSAGSHFIVINTDSQTIAEYGNHE